MAVVIGVGTFIESDMETMKIIPSKLGVNEHEFCLPFISVWFHEEGDTCALLSSEGKYPLGVFEGFYETKFFRALVCEDELKQSGWVKIGKF